MRLNMSLKSKASEDNSDVVTEHCRSGLYVRRVFGLNAIRFERQVGVP